MMWKRKRNTAKSGVNAFASNLASIMEEMLRRSLSGSHCVTRSGSTPFPKRCTDAKRSAILHINSRWDTVKQSGQALKGKVWVNIVDLVDSRRTGGKVERFESMEELREYTKDTNRVFPKEEAKKNGFLAALLITL